MAIILGLGPVGVKSEAIVVLSAAGDIYGDAYCAVGYMGPLCAVCDPNGYYLDVSGDEPVLFFC